VCAALEADHRDPVDRKSTF